MVISIEMLRGRLLIATDNATDSQTLSEALSAHRFCAEIIDPSLALAETWDNPPVDLALIGSERPEALRYCATLRKACAGLPIVFLIASPPDPDAFESAAFEAGADDVLYGPFSERAARRLTVLARRKQQYDDAQQRLRDLQEAIRGHEQQLARAQESARQFSILKDSIINNVSHEMRTPLLQVKSAIGMMDAEINGSSGSSDGSGGQGPSDGLGRMIEFAKQSAARLESVVQNISQLAKSIDLRSEPFAAADALSIAMRQLNRLWTTANQVHRVSQRVAPRLPLVLGDKNGIGQVLQQLISNGLKFSPDGGPVEVVIEPAPAGDQVRFAVRDYGIGIEPAQFERIFQAFYQVDYQSTRKFEGAGVGLAIVRYILDQMGVQIQVESAPRQGSTFSFALPVAQLA